MRCNGYFLMFFLTEAVLLYGQVDDCNSGDFDEFRDSLIDKINDVRKSAHETPLNKSCKLEHEAEVYTKECPLHPHGAPNNTFIYGRVEIDWKFSETIDPVNTIFDKWRNGTELQIMTEREWIFVGCKLTVCIESEIVVSAGCLFGITEDDVTKSPAPTTKQTTTSTEVSTTSSAEMQ
ncbi:hypothetical protein DICVIV_13975, partial [Dictyocaulus viviparus]